MPALSEALPRARGLVRKRAFHLALGSLACGLACAGGSPVICAAVAGLTLALTASLRAARLGFLCSALFLSGAAAGTQRLQAIDEPGRSVRADSWLAGRAHLLERPRPSRFGSRAEVRMTSGPGKGARLLARATREMRWPAGTGVGSEVVVAGRVHRPRARGDGGFDFSAYLRRRGVAAELWLGGVRSGGGRRGGLQGTVDSMRRRAEGALSAGVSPRTEALLRGMVLGQDDLIDEGTRQDWRDSGLAHLLAVSGQNVMLLVALALPLLAATGLPPRARVAGAIGLIGIYVLLAGAGPSLQRAAVMGAASLAALSVARPASRPYALLLAACATLLLNPRACGDAGWQLSFAAVAGILILAPRLSGGPLRALPRLVADGVAITVAATLATAPLLAHHFGAVSPAGLPANVLALPLVAPIMWLGMLRAALGQAMDVGAGAPPLGGAVDAAAQVVNAALGAALVPLMSGLAGLARAFSDVPGGQVALPVSSPIAVAAVYGVLGVAALSASRLGDRLEPSLTVAAAGWRRRSAVRRIAIVCICGGVLALALARLMAAPGTPTTLTVSFLDVGQGDATLVQHPDGSAVLFDGGPPEGRAARLLRRAGVRRLSAVVMTHASRDHHGGLLEVVERFPVGLLVDGGDGAADRSFRETVATATARGARRVPGIAPLTLHAGAITIRLLSPRRRPAGPAPEDPNPRAVVAVVSADGFDLLLSADAESPTLSSLRLPDVDAMKVPHHGSADPGLPQVLGRLRPEVAAVPVGPNTYGHPTSSTLAALRAAGASVHRTDRDGTVQLTVNEGEVRIGGERARPVGRGP